MQTLSMIVAEHNIVLNQKFVLTNFEMAEMRSFTREFPNAQAKGCLFQLSPSIYRRIKMYGLAPRYGNDVVFALQMRELLALAYLPAHEIEASFFAIKITYPDEVKPLLEWFESTYVLGRKRRHSQVTRSDALFPTKMWSVYDSVTENIPRTQNVVESWHNRWWHLVGENPCVYALIQSFREKRNKVRCKSQPVLAGIIKNYQTSKFNATKTFFVLWQTVKISPRTNTCWV